MALRWVRDNAAVFGGDPDNVTIFGESAGAHAVATLLATPAAKGLFAQAISESPASVRGRTVGVARASPTISSACRRGLEGRRVGADGRQFAQLTEVLNEVMQLGMTDMRGAFPVGPTYGTDYLPQDPLQAMREGTAHRVPLIVGTNADEGRLFTRFLQLLPTTEPAIRHASATCTSRRGPHHQRLHPGYPSRSACVRLGGDFAFGTAAWQIASAHGQHAPTYVYRYDYAPRTFHRCCSEGMD